MAKEVTGYIKLQIPGGSANPSPPVGPALGQKGVNIMQFVKEFNARTADMRGTVIPVVITNLKNRGGADLKDFSGHDGEDCHGQRQHEQSTGQDTSDEQGGGWKPSHQSDAPQDGQKRWSWSVTEPQAPQVLVASMASSG